MALEVRAMVPVHIKVLVRLADSPESSTKAWQYFQRVIEFPCLPSRDLSLLNSPLDVDYNFEKFYFDLEYSRFEALIRDECEDEEQFQDSRQSWLQCGFTALADD